MERFAFAVLSNFTAVFLKRFAREGSNKLLLVLFIEGVATIVFEGVAVRELL